MLKVTPPLTTLTMGISEPNTPKAEPSPCSISSQHHNTEDCSTFKALYVNQRAQLAKEKRLCFRCLKHPATWPNRVIFEDDAEKKTANGLLSCLEIPSSYDLFSKYLTTVPTIIVKPRRCFTTQHSRQEFLIAALCLLFQL